jgi:ferredoxin
VSVYPQIRAERCTRYRFRYSECQHCVEACPHEALTLSEEGVALDEAHCRNCGLCAAACPSETFLAGNLARVDLLRAAARKPTYAFACAPSGQPGDVVVPCLGALDAAMLGWLVARGVNVALHGAGHCVDCEHAPRGEQRLALALDACDVLRAGLGDASWGVVELRETCAETATDPHHADRRQWLRRLVGRGIDAAVLPAKVPAAPVAMRAIRAAAPFRTIGRDLLQAIAWPPTTQAKSVQTPPVEPRRIDLPTHPGLTLGNLALAPGCIACEACARVCPTGALVVRESPHAWQLAFNPTRCVGCAVCVEACQPRVLSLVLRHGEQVFEDAQTPLHGLPKRRCPSCDRPYVDLTGRDTCPICHSDDADFAAIFG